MNDDAALMTAAWNMALRMGLRGEWARQVSAHVVAEARRNGTTAALLGR